MKYKKLGEECYIVMGQSPESKTYNSKKEGTPFLQGRKTFGRIYPYINTWTTQPIRIGKKGSILFSVRAPVGDVNIATEEICIGRGLASISMKNKHNLYLYYLLLNNRENIKNMSTGTVFESINRSELENLVLKFHEEEEQCKVEKLLGCMDKKIELNNKMNNNLYNQMEALYKEYFIDNIKKEEWKKTNIYEIANIIYGAPFKSSLFNTNNEGTPIVRIRDLKNQEFKTYTTEKHPKGYLIQKGDIVVGMDGEFRPYIWGNDEAWLNQRVCVFENIREKGKAFLYFTIKPLLMNVEMTETATTVIHIGKNDFDKFEINLPPEKLLIKYDTITTEMIKKIINNISQNKILEKLRDTLLPKLMNGEIDLDNIEI